jgi:hypothetical protein
VSDSRNGALVFAGLMTVMLGGVMLLSGFMDRQADKFKRQPEPHQSMPEKYPSPVR